MSAAILNNVFNAVSAESEQVKAQSLEQAREIAASRPHMWLLARKIELNSLVWWKALLFHIVCRKLFCPSGRKPTDRGVFAQRWQVEAECKDEWDYFFMLPLNHAYGRGDDDMEFYGCPFSADPKERERNRLDRALFERIEQPDEWRVSVIAPRLSPQPTGLKQPVTVEYMLNETKLRCLERCLAAMERADGLGSS